MSNITFGNETSGISLPSNVIILIACVSAVSIPVNISYIIVCFDAFKKEFHHLLVLSLCFSDSWLGFSVVWSMLSSLFPSVQRSYRSCQFTLFALSFGLLFTYTLIFMLCLVRYLSIKSFNFGIREKFKRIKFSLVTGSFAFAFVVSCVGILFLPCNTTISMCSTADLYGDYKLHSVSIIMGTLTILIVLIIAVTLCNIYCIWKIFFKAKNRVGPQILNQFKKTSEESKAWSNSHRLEKTFNTTQLFEQPMPSRSNIQSQNSDYSVDCISLRNIEIDTSASVTHNPFRFSTSKMDQVRTSKCEKEQNIKWEIKAFVTNVIIAATTLLLTGPFIMTSWLDILSEAHVEMRTKMIALLLSVLNCFVDPMVYAWRIPEIRDQFKKAFRIK